MFLGVALGVAVVVAVDLANASAGRAFDLATEAVAGKATHQINGGPDGLDEALYSGLRRTAAGIPLAPVIVEYVTSPQLGGAPMQLLGVDPFVDAEFRDYLRGNYGGNPADVAGAAAIDLTVFLTQPGAVIISGEVAGRYALEPGGSITIETAGRSVEGVIAGIASPNDSLNRRALEGLILTDIGTAQEIVGRLGRLDRIDVLLPENDPEVEARLRAFLPPEARLDTVAARSGAVEQMTEAFRVNLTALSLLALIVGMFLIYNTITFSVVQRRALFGSLRSLGVTREEVFFLVMGEALLTGVIGSGLGLGLGLLMGQGAVQMVTQTINDLFFVVTVRGVQISGLSLIKGAGVGLAATLLSAALPAWEAASVSPKAAMLRSGLEAKARQAVRNSAWSGAGMIGVGTAILAVLTRSLIAGFAATFFIVVGFAMLVPFVVDVVMRRVTGPLGRLFGSLGKMAPRGVSNSLSRTAVAVMALMVAVSVTIGVGLMIASFRSTVITWLDETLQGDIYISAPSISATTPSATLDPQVVEILRAWTDSERTDVLRSATVDSPDGPLDVLATDNSSIGFERIFLRSSIPPSEIWNEMLAGSVLVSEPLSNRLALPESGARITLNTPDGPLQAPVLGVYYDYSSTRGAIMMALPVYRERWGDDRLTAAAVRLRPGVDVDAAVIELQQALKPVQRVIIRPNQALRAEALNVFDRTFAITGALQLLATLVAFIGVLSSLLSLELERQRELGILRSVGMTARQLWGLILLETGLMGGMAGVLSLPAGYSLALILIYIINRRSFGWTLQMDLDPTPFGQAMLIAITAALIAGLYPAWRMSRMVISDALRSE